MKWYVYIIESDIGSLYTGISTDVIRRFKEHSSKGPKGAKFFRSCCPKSIAWQEEHENRSSALQRELAIKKMTREEKLQLIERYQRDNKN